MPTQAHEKPVFVASDVHLGSISEDQRSAFLTWLDQAGDAASWIILNGDLFDFWFEYAWGTTRGHTEALERLRGVVDSGVRVTLMGGNHDWWGGRFLRDEVGVEYHLDAIEADLGDKRALIAHGDGLGKGDLSYRLLRLVLRGRLTRWSFAALPPVVGDTIARGISKTEGRWCAPGPTEIARAEALQAWALDTLEARPELDVVFLGHTHVPQLVEVGGNRWYVNSGDWVYHRSYAVVRNGQPPELLHWEGSIAC